MDPTSTTSQHDEQTLSFARHVEPEIEVLLRVARSLTGSRADAEDLVQETLIRAFKSADRFDGAHPRAWLLTIMRRANINTHRRRRPAPADPHGELVNRPPAFGDATGRAPEDLVNDTVMDDHVEQALADLDPRFRGVLLLVDVDQLSYQETADALGIPVGTVMSRLSRARSRMRASLETTPSSHRRHR
ncbi:RNA polymerase subunit sigma-70 [Aeromicrobium sp. A1-2]|nr:RNA polymerase subunit sigma-70 [Aeromicrobium sp. A1-2]